MPNGDKAIDMESVLDTIAKLVTGGVIWQLVKAAAGHIFKARADRKREVKKLLASDVEKLAMLVDPLLRSSMVYYGAPSAEGKALARTIRMDLKSFAMQWNSACAAVTAQSRRAPDLRLMIEFRQALTSRLDVERPDALALDDPTVIAIYDAGQAVRDALSTLRYDLA